MEKELRFGIMNSSAANPNYSETVGIPRPVEAVLALVGLLISAPLLVLAGLGIALTSKGPIIFRQSRVGKDGRTFILYKLRTMRAARGGPQVTASDDSRVTSVGRFLRKMKIDELPELWNVLKGDMSLVGPRPEVPHYVDLNNRAWQCVLKVRPGITDPLTLRLRNEEKILTNLGDDRERFYLETLQPFKLKGYMDYLQSRSWQSDLRTLWRTWVAIIFPGASPHPTLKEILSHTAGKEDQ